MDMEIPDKDSYKFPDHIIITKKCTDEFLSEESDLSYVKFLMAVIRNLRHGNLVRITFETIRSKGCATNTSYKKAREKAIVKGIIIPAPSEGRNYYRVNPHYIWKGTLKHRYAFLSKWESYYLDFQNYTKSRVKVELHLVKDEI